MLTSFNKMWYSQQGSSPPPASAYTVYHWKSATSIISCAWSRSLGRFSGTHSPHVCFITSSSGVIYGSRAGHSSELLISAENKRKSWLYYPDGVGLFTRQTDLIGELQQACITHIWSAFPDAINRPPCEEAITEQNWCVLNTKWYLLEHKFHYCQLLMLTDILFSWLILKRAPSLAWTPADMVLSGSECLVPSQSNTLLSSDVLFQLVK